jgi:undecaprenyl-phosphate galactose phosphotransferase
MLAIAMLLAADGPILYVHERIGRGKVLFPCFKFRTMYADADERLVSFLKVSPAAREEWERDFKLKNDPRITAVGRVLRQTSLDELPQLWNVLRGDMSLVGPRPIVEKELLRYGCGAVEYLSVRPGITGLWQVNGRNRTTYDRRVELDLYYVRNWTLRLDFAILIKTVWVVAIGYGAY